MGFKAEAIHVFFMTDDDGDEGVPAFLGLHTGTWMPLLATNRVRLEQLRPMAERLAKQRGRAITLVRFDQRKDLEEITP